MGLQTIILAAGQGTRMKSSLPKVLHQVAGMPIVSWVLNAVADTSPDRTLVVVGHEAEAVRAVLPAGVAAVNQDEQLGTGHAAQLALEAAPPQPEDIVLVVPGDHPLLSGQTLVDLVATHRADGAAATLVTHSPDDPAGYGRVVRDDDARVIGIVEDADTTPSQAGIREVNSAIYAFSASELLPLLDRLEPHNVQGEYYLTDVIGMLAEAGARLSAITGTEADCSGVNSMEQLAAAATMMRRRINSDWMAEGVWMLEPDRVYVDAGVLLSSGVRLYPGVHLEGETSVAAGAEVGPDTHVRNTRIGEDAVVQYSVLDGAEVGARATVGPYARLREGTVLGPESKAGTFVEMKQTTLGARSKVPHLSYMGDAEIGEDSNIGAATITCNYDGFEKHRTVIGDRVRIGSDTLLVAPLEVGDDAWTGAGSVISHDVSPGALAVERGAQREVPDYAARRRRLHRSEGDE